MYCVEKIASGTFDAIKDIKKAIVFAILRNVDSTFPLLTIKIN